MNSFCISAIASNQGKTILTTALLHYFRKSVQPFKIGPDYIDPQFHKQVCGEKSINLDSFIYNKKQIKWLYNNYSTKKVSILEGVMGFYDGDNKNCSANIVTKLLKIPTILILDGKGSYITVSAVLKGLISYTKHNTIKGIVLNNISSQMHYLLIKDQILKDHKNITVLGWIKKDLPTLQDTHLGLDLNSKNDIQNIAKDVLENIDIELLLSITKSKKSVNKKYPFKDIQKIDQHLCIVYDKNFSFAYFDNFEYLKTVYNKVTFINSYKDDSIPKDCDMVYICGGYVETPQAYKSLQKAKRFKKSLIKHSKTKPIYGECAGLLYLGKSVDDKKMSGILDISFTLQNRFVRLGYYYNSLGIKGHSFHYTKPTNENKGVDILSKTLNGKGANGTFISKNKKIIGTYLHTMYRDNIPWIELQKL